MNAAATVSPGDRFGERTVVRLLGERSGQKRVRVLCDCGREDNIYLADLRAGRSGICLDCRRRRHGDKMRSRRIHVRCPKCDHLFTTNLQGES